MLTLSFLWSWTKTTALAGLALVIEHAVITGFGIFALTAVVTIGAWLVITIGLYREWRARGTGYRHEVAEITDRADRRPR